MAVKDDSLALWFTPDAIRQHFEGDEDAIGSEGDASRAVAKASDDQLREVGEYCVTADTLYREFHRLLICGVEEVLGL